MIVYGADEALLWAKRVYTFQGAMRGTLGDRRRTFQWYGSVLDSVMGVFLTQNVADHLSSRAFMEVAARWPAREACNEVPLERADSVDWEAVRRATPSELADAIRCRGLMNHLSSKMQSCLNSVREHNLKRLHSRWASESQESALCSVLQDMVSAVQALDEAEQVQEIMELMLSSASGNSLFNNSNGTHNRAMEAYREMTHHPDTLLSLEWLRAVPAEEARAYLSSIDGLGSKSVACLMLLTLNQRDFPVDTNVGRICARIGWIPLDAQEAVEELDDYAPEPEVHMYLRSRLLGFNLETLYELHYQMITLGKVFCSKSNPNCTSCPMREDCEYALNNGPSLHGRKRIRSRFAADLQTFAPIGATMDIESIVPEHDMGSRPLHWKTRQKLQRLDALRQKGRYTDSDNEDNDLLEKLINNTPRRPRTKRATRQLPFEEDAAEQDCSDMHSLTVEQEYDCCMSQQCGDEVEPPVVRNFAEVERLLCLGEQLVSVQHAVAVTSGGTACAVLEDRALELSLLILGVERPSVEVLTPTDLSNIMSDVKHRYRILGMHIHPDKCQHESADKAFSILSEALAVIEERVAGRGGSAGVTESAVASAPLLTLKQGAPGWQSTNTIDCGSQSRKVEGWLGAGSDSDKKVHVHTRDRLVLPAKVLTPEIQRLLALTSSTNRRTAAFGCPKHVLDIEAGLFIPFEELPMLTDADGTIRRPPKPSHVPFVSECVEGVLLVSCRVARRGRFPLNGTYFQVNELFVDNSTVARPLQIPRVLLDTCSISQVHFGLSIHFMVKGMSKNDVAKMFSFGFTCFRAYEPSTGSPCPLPSFLLPTPLKNAKSNWKNSTQRAAQKFAKLAKHGVLTVKEAEAMVAPPPPPTRYIRTPLGEEVINQIPQLLQASEERPKFHLEETYFSPQPRYGNALHPGMASSKFALKRPLGNTISPMTPRKTTKALNTDKPPPSGRTRVDRFPKMKRSQRCGWCHTCLNPQMKKACLTRRAEMGEGCTQAMHRTKETWLDDI